MDRPLQTLSEHSIELLVGLGGLIVLLFLFRLMAGRTRTPCSSDGLNPEARKALAQRRKMGDEQGVADLLYRKGDFERAAEIYHQLNNHTRAAEAYERAGKTGPAIQAFKRAGQRDRAAKIALDKGLFTVAAREYEDLGRHAQAAEAYERAEQWSKAGELYAELEEYGKAAELFSRGNSPTKLAECYVKIFQQAHKGSGRHKKEQLEESRQKVKEAAEIYAANNLPDEALDALTAGKFHVEAATLCQELGRIQEAAELFEQGGDFAQASEAYASLKDEKNAARCLGETLIKNKQPRKAAKALADAGDSVRAAELLAKVGDHLEAAKLYRSAKRPIKAAEQLVKGGKPKRAAELYNEAGETDHAAELMVSVGDFDKAAAYFTASGDHFNAGAALARAGRKLDALAMFNKVGEFGERGQQARAREGKILFQLGRPKQAQEKFEKAIDGRPNGPETVDLYYKIARCLESRGSKTEAYRIFKDVHSVDPKYADTRSRLRTLQKEVKAMSTIAAQSGGVPGTDGDTATPERYEILDEVARGGMGVVYRARDNVLNRVVAFKILSDVLKANRRAVQYFLREARAAAAVSHPNIVTIFDAGQQGGDYYLAMEYVDGETLKQLTKRHGAIDESDLRRITQQSCQGLTYAHDKGLVHRDIKSSNLMLTQDKIIKIMDFGLAKFVRDAQKDHTKAIGTPYYMSPEQITGKELDCRSDIYSFGITLFECATGKVPFAKGDLSYHHIHTPAPRARSFNSSLSKRLDLIIDRCIRKKPDDRFQSAAEILELLDR